MTTNPTRFKNLFSIIITCLLMMTPIIVSCGSSGGGDGTGASPTITAVNPSGNAGASGATARFTATTTGSPTSFSWRLGDGALPNTSSSSSPTVTLGAEGSYTGSLTVSNADGTSASFSFSYSVSAAASRTMLGTQSIGPLGGTKDYGDLIIEAFNNSVVDTVVLEVATLDALPANLPDGFTIAGDIYNIDVTSGENAIEAAFQMSFSNITAEAGDLISILHYNEGLGKYEPTTIHEMDPMAGTVRVESRVFSVFIPTTSKMNEIPNSYQVQGYLPNTKGWSIQNFGSYFAPNGNCLGMSAFSVWAFTALDIDLYTDVTGQDALLLATRSHLANSQTWTVRQFNGDVNIDNTRISADLRANIIKYYLYRFQEPVVFFMQKGNSASGHAAVFYGYDDFGFDVYDSNHPGVERRIDYDEVSWGTSQEGSDYDKFAMIANPSLGRNTDFGFLWAAYQNGFNGPGINIVNPPNFNDSVEAINIVIQGTVTIPGWNKVSIWVKDRRFDGPINGNTFSVEVPLSIGDNQITVVAGSDLAAQNSFSPGSGSIRFNLERTTSNNITSVVAAVSGVLVHYNNPIFIDERVSYETHGNYTGGFSGPTFTGNYSKKYGDLSAVSGSITVTLDKDNDVVTNVNLSEHLDSFWSGYTTDTSFTLTNIGLEELENYIETGAEVCNHIDDLKFDLTNQADPDFSYALESYTCDSGSQLSVTFLE